MTAGMIAAMTGRRFDWTLRARGPALAAWPDGEREAARLLLRDSPLARQHLADALAAEEAPPPPDTITLCRMQAVVHRALAPAGPVLRRLRWGALVAATAAGVAIGVATAEPDHGAELGSTIEATFPATVLAALDQ